MVGEEPREAHVLSDWCNDIVGMMPPQTKRSKMVSVKVIRGLPCVSCQACSVLDL